MSADTNNVSWVDLCEEEFGDADSEVNCEKDEKRVVEDEKHIGDICSDESLSSTVMNDSFSEVTKEEDGDLKEKDCDTTIEDIKEEVTEKPLNNTDENVITKFIKMEKDSGVTEAKLKEDEEKMIDKLIKIEKDDQSPPDESNGLDDLDDLYLITGQAVKPEVAESKLLDTKVKTEPKTELKTESNAELEIEGAEDEWCTLAGAQEEKAASNRPTFAQICAKNASPAPVPAMDVDTSNLHVSPSKKQRKRSLFPESLDSKKEVFGILDENSVDSPCKDIRNIMTNIHMDSPLRSDTENIEISQRKIAVARRSNLMDSLDSSNSSNLRKRCRDASKSSDSPASKMPHYSNSPKASKDGKDSKDTTAKKSKAYETDKGTLSRRQKQIDYGKNTKGYDNYIKMVPKDKRDAHHPKTPPKHIMYSRRAWDGLIKVWRQKLHFWDLPSEGGQGGIGLPDSWDSLSETSLSVSNSDEMSDKSMPTTPQADRKRVRQGSTISLDSVSTSVD